MAHNKASTNLVREKWGSDLGLRHDDDQWSSLLMGAQKYYISVQYKIFPTKSF